MPDKDWAVQENLTICSNLFFQIIMFFGYCAQFLGNWETGHRPKCSFLGYITNIPASNTNSPSTVHCRLVLVLMMSRPLIVMSGIQATLTHHCSLTQLHPTANQCQGQGVHWQIWQGCCKAALINLT
jgi:hypothetical protein